MMTATRYRQTIRNGALAAASLGLLGLGTSAGATTKGLNQIVTPDVQPDGVLSVSLQQTDPNITNRYEAQLELGLTDRFEIAAFQGFSPDEQILNAEYGIIQGKEFLLSTGFANYSTKGVAPQTYLEAGYQHGRSYAMAGAIQVVVQETGGENAGGYQHQTQSIFGYAYHVNPRLLLQLDYQSGQANSATAGFTYSITPTLQFNPSVYIANSSRHNALGYAVLTWNITAWNPKHRG